MKSAAKVGALLVVFVLLLLASFAFLGSSILPKRNQTYYVSLTDAGGLLVGTRVLMAGVQIGTVEHISLVDAHRALLTLRIHEGVGIPNGTVAVIQGSLIGLGDTPLDLVAPMATQGFLPQGTTIPGRKAGPLDAMLPNGGRELYTHVNKTLAAVQELLQDRRLHKDLTSLLETTDSTLKASQVTLAKFNALVGRTDTLLARNEGNLDAIIGQTRGTIEQVQFTAKTLADFVRAGKLQKGTTDILQKAVKIEAQASNLLASLDKTVSNPALRGDVATTAQNVREASGRLPDISRNTQEITKNVAEITEHAKPLPDELNDVAKKASKLEDKLGDLINKFSGAPSNFQGLRSLSTEIDEIRQTEPGHWRTDINGSLPTHGGFVTFGLYDAFEKDRLNLQLGKSITPNLDYRYGVYASKPGVGVDWDISRKLGLRTDLRDINSPEFDARLHYDFGGGLIGWAGVERIFSTTSPAFGIGIRR